MYVEIKYLTSDTKDGEAINKIKQCAFLIVYMK